MSRLLQDLLWPASILNKDTSVRYGTGYLPEAESKGQTPLDKAKVFTTQARAWIFQHVVEESQVKKPYCCYSYPSNSRIESKVVFKNMYNIAVLLLSRSREEK